MVFLKSNWTLEREKKRKILTDMRHGDGETDFVGVVWVSGSGVAHPGGERLGSDGVGDSWHAHAVCGADDDGRTGMFTAGVAL